MATSVAKIIITKMAERVVRRSRRARNEVNYNPIRPIGISARSQRRFVQRQMEQIAQLAPAIEQAANDEERPLTYFMTNRN